MSNGKEEHYTDSKFKWWDGGGDRKCLKKKKEDVMGTLREVMRFKYLSIFQF